MRTVLAIGVIIFIFAAIALLITLPEPRASPFNDTEQRTSLTILANEYADRQRADEIEPTSRAQHACGPYGLFPEYANSTGSDCVSPLSNRSFAIHANDTRFEAGYVVFETAENASAQMNGTLQETRVLLSEQLIPNGEIENYNAIVRGQLGPDVDQARFFSAQLNASNDSTYRTISLLRVERTIFFVIEDSAEQIIRRRYNDAFSSEKHERLLEIYDVNVIG